MERHVAVCSVFLSMLITKNTIVYCKMVELKLKLSSFGCGDEMSTRSTRTFSHNHAFARARWRLGEMSIIYLLVYSVILTAMFTPVASGDHGSYEEHTNEVEKAVIKLMYNDSNGTPRVESSTYGNFGENSPLSTTRGLLVQVRTMYNKKDGNKTDGCTEIEPSIVPKRKWIALVKRGTCTFNEKIHFAGKLSNASAVVVYNNEDHDQNQHTGKDEQIRLEGKYDVTHVVAVYIRDSQRGQYLVDLLNIGTEITMEITVDPTIPSTTPHTNGVSPNNTSVLFVSISFIVLIIISLAWLVFYYIQRCRYSNAKERLNRTLANAAKKAIAKIPQRSVKFGDKELDPDADQCAVCIEPYKLSDVIRILPCKHVFHKPCVDPWLLDQRSCPMCKLDILKAFGMLVNMNGSQESVPQEHESGLLASSPVLEDTEHLSNSEEQGAVGGVKIVLYQREAVRFRNCDDPEFSSECSVESAAGTSRTAQCHIECTNESLLERPLHNHLSLAPSLSMESLHSVDSECNEKQSLMSGLVLEDESASIPRQKKGSASRTSLHVVDVSES